MSLSIMYLKSMLIEFDCPLDCVITHWLCAVSSAHSLLLGSVLEIVLVSPELALPMF